MFRQRIRLFFKVEGPARYLSQLDFLGAFERAIRRAAVPVRMSEGFNPRPKLSFPLARPVGVVSREEVCEIELSCPMGLELLVRGLDAELPEGVMISHATYVAPNDKARAVAVRYTFRFRTEREAAALPVGSFLARTEHRLEREGKKRSIDARELVRSMECRGDTLCVEIRATPDGSLRPQEILGALDWTCEDPSAVSISREVVCEERVAGPKRSREDRPLVRRRGIRRR